MRASKADSLYQTSVVSGRKVGNVGKITCVLDALHHLQHPTNYSKKSRKNILLTNIDWMYRFMPLGGRCAGGWVKKVTREKGKSQIKKSQIKWLNCTELHWAALSCTTSNKQVRASKADSLYQTSVVSGRKVGNVGKITCAPDALHHLYYPPKYSNMSRKNILLTYIDWMYRFMPVGGRCAGGWVKKKSEEYASSEWIPLVKVCD